MSGLKKTSKEVRFLIGLIAAVAVIFVLFLWGLYATMLDPKAKPAFKPMELACVDTEGKAATKDTTLRYYRDGGTIVGYDEQGMLYVYTPPRGWVCRFGEVKKL